MRRRGKRHACREGHRARDCRTLKEPATASAAQRAVGCNGAARGQPRGQYPCLRRPVLDEVAHTQPVPWPNLSVITISLDTCIVSAIWLEGGNHRLTACGQQAGGAPPNSIVILNPMKSGKDSEQGEHCQRRSKYLLVSAIAAHIVPTTLLESTVLHRSGKM